MRQYQLQLSYHKNVENCDNFTQAEWRQWSRDMNEIMNFVRRHDYYYLIRQGSNTHFEKLEVVQRVSIQEYVYIADRPILLDNLKIKLCQVEAKDPSFCSTKHLADWTIFTTESPNLLAWIERNLRKVSLMILIMRKTFKTATKQTKIKTTGCLKSITSGRKITQD